MAITKLVSANTPNPITLGEGGDWDLAMAQLTACKQVIQGQQMVLTEWTNVTTVPKLAEGSYLQHLGAIYIVDTEDYTIGTLTADDVYSIQLSVDGDTLAVSFITDISGFSWNAQYNGVYDSSNNQVLPYTVEVFETATEFEKYKWLNVNPSMIVDYLGNVKKDNDMSIGGDLSVGGSLSATGALTGSTLDTGQGANELHPMNQGVRTTDAVQFAEVTIGSLPSMKAGVVEIINIDGTDYNIPSMAVGELRCVVGTIGYGDSVKTPTDVDSAYLVIVDDSTSDATLKYLPSNATVASASGGFKLMIVRFI